MLSYTWNITEEVNQLLIELEAVKILFEKLPQKPLFEENLRRHSLLKSSVYSARIEGFSDSIISPKKESQNLLSAYCFVYSSKSPKKLSMLFIKKLHKLTLKNITGNCGQWRTEPWAIFNQSGSVIYLAPPHIEVPKLMSGYFSYINKLSVHPAIKSAVAQFIFEKIHPFADGNGRVGRLISSHLLEKNGYGFRGLSPFEEYLDSHREEYYAGLEPNQDCTPFITFFLKALIFQSKQILSKFDESTTDLPEDSLLPRRKEILNIIRDHPYATFDSLQRRFTQINPKTLHNDILNLIKQKFIRKVGSTRGASYLATNNPTTP